MALTLDPILRDAGISPDAALAIRHAYVGEHEDTGLVGIHAESTDAEILHYTARQSSKRGVFPAKPATRWVVFIREASGRARLWCVLENHGEMSDDGRLRTFDLSVSDHLTDLRNRLVIEWPSPRAWRINGTTAARYPVLEIADSQPVPFPGFSRLILDYAQLQAVMREHRYTSWRTALGSVVGIYLITDTRDGRHYVGKADGQFTIQQRWGAYAANGHGGNADLRTRDASTFRFSLLRVFDPSTPAREINETETHFKRALDSLRHGMNRN